MSELVAFARELLCEHGALVEETGNGVEVMLPASLADRFRLPEHAELTVSADGPPTHRLVYGTDLVDQLVELATEPCPVALATWTGPRYEPADPEAYALGKLTGLNCVFRPSDQAAVAGWACYLVVDYRYTADADERNEGLIRVVVNEETGAWVPSLADLESDPFSASGLAAASTAPPSAAAFVAAARGARAQLRRALVHLRGAIERRHARDRVRLGTYFGDLRKEMVAQLDRLLARTHERERDVRIAKIESLDQELGRKLHDLAVRYHVNVELRPVAALRVAMPVVRVHILAKRRQAESAFVLHIPAATKTLDPLPCAACGDSTYAFALCDTKLHILCARCHGGRRSSRDCAACSIGPGAQ
jgi:hypothetical protein